MIIVKKTEFFECLLDKEDEIYFSAWNWNWRKGYAGRKRTKKDEPGNAWVHLHREVIKRMGLAIPTGMCVDHINRNRMDNRRCNLRIVSMSENSKNVSQEIKLKRKEYAAIANKASASKPRTEKQISACKRNKSASKMVIDTKTNTIYSSVKDAAAILGVNHDAIRKWLKGKTTKPYIEKISHLSWFK